jgi:hypothetical protein
MERSTRRAHAIAVIAATCSSCAGSCGTGQHAFAVWSDDGAAYGILVRTYETRPGLIWELQDYKSSGVMLEDPATHRRTAIGQEWEDIASDGRLYFMRRQGYFLYASREIDRGDFFREVRMDGTEQDVPGSVPLSRPDCPSLDVVPSPDGRILAEVTSTRPDCLTSTVSLHTVVDVAFFDARTLEPDGVKSRVELPILPHTTWTPAGDFIVVAETWTHCQHESASCVPTQCLETWRIAPTSGAEPVDPPGCTEPPTTSSAISADGVALEVDADNSVRTSEFSTKTAFGCQTSAAALPRCP